MLSTTLVGASFLYIASPGKSDLGWGETRFIITELNLSAHPPVKVIAANGGRGGD